MSRLTKTGLWLIPWFPACLAAFFAVMYITSRKQTHSVFVPADGSPWETVWSPAEMAIIAAARPILFVSLVALALGVLLLSLGLVRRIRHINDHSTSNHE